MTDATIDDLLAEQKTTNTILRAAYRRQLDEIVDDLLKDKASVLAVSTLAEGSKSAGDLMNSMAAATSLKGTAIGERLSALVEAGVVIREGGGPSTTYKLGTLLTSGQVAKIRNAAKVKANGASPTE